ncbi:MAG TPA: hypothetical protein VJL90_15090 [Pseudorhodoplanes sp.]|nr:hypothetical protein [Pseudorhodoplanes sp.]
MDSNSDGQLSKAEGKATKGLSKAWKKLDTDNSGSLSAAEFAAFEAKAETDVKAKPADAKGGMGGGLGIGQ